MRSDEEKSQLIVMSQQQAAVAHGGATANAGHPSDNATTLPELPPDDMPDDTPAQKYGTSPMSEEDKKRLLQMIFTVMETQPDIFSADFSLARLTEMVGSKRQYVSQVINEKFEKSFNTLLNEYRIKEACKRMR